MIAAVEVPSTVAEAVSTLRSEGAAVLAGGTTLMPKVIHEVTPITTLVSTRRLDNASIEVSDRSVRIGAATTLAAMGRNDSLAFLHDAVASVASPTVRNMATIGGNLFAEQPFGDIAVCLLALGASVDVLGSNGESTAEVEQVIGGGVGSDELVTHINFDIPSPGSWFYTKAMRRKLNSASIVTVAANLEFSDTSIASARIGLGGAGPTALRSPGAEAALTGTTLSVDSVDAAAAAALADADFFTDAYASAWYRERVFPVHFRRALLGEEARS
jgi:CO/xanthine dehydrogenase FAD-binding subunit